MTLNVIVHAVTATSPKATPMTASFQADHDDEVIAAGALGFPIKSLWAENVATGNATGVCRIGITIPCCPLEGWSPLEENCCIR